MARPHRWCGDVLTRAVKAAELAALVLTHEHTRMSERDRETIRESIRRLALEVASQTQDKMPIIEGKGSEEL